jgi:hypothetical protein
MAIKFNKKLSLQDAPKFTQIWIFGLKIYHLATLIRWSGSHIFKMMAGSSSTSLTRRPTEEGTF